MLRVLRVDDEDEGALLLRLLFDAPQQVEVERVESRDQHPHGVAQIARGTRSEHARRRRLDDRADPVSRRHKSVLLEPGVSSAHRVDVDVQSVRERPNGGQATASLEAGVGDEQRQLRPDLADDRLVRRRVEPQVRKSIRQTVLLPRHCTVSV